MSNNGSMVWLETIINRYILMDPEMAAKISAFGGKVIAVDVQGFNRTVYMLPKGSRICVTLEYDGMPDTVLKGSPAALFKMGLSKNVATMMLSGEIEITGDVRLGREFKNMLAEMDIDWEEHLASIFGDASAHQLMKFAKKITDWGQRAATSVTLDVSEYLQEESRDVVSGSELEMFYQDVDNLRNDVDRLQARIDALKKGARTGSV
jgi:ubiquinone biosynthesis protein UbiJ